MTHYPIPSTLQNDPKKEEVFGNKQKVKWIGRQNDQATVNFLYINLFYWESISIDCKYFVELTITTCPFTKKRPQPTPISFHFVWIGDNCFELSHYFDDNWMTLGECEWHSLSIVKGFLVRFFCISVSAKRY